MADIARINPVSAFDGVARPGRHGRAVGPAGVMAREVTGLGLASVAARAGQAQTLAAVVREAFAVTLPIKPARADGSQVSMIWTGPDQWLALAAVAPAQGLELLLAPVIGPHASIVDQSHARAILRLSGPRVRDALAKGLNIDLHPRAFKPGDAAATVLAHMSVQIWQIDTAPTYEISVARGYAGSFWSWLTAAAAEFGLSYGEGTEAGR